MEKTVNPKYLKLLFIVPSLFGFGGDVVNERELAKALSKKVERMYVITFLDANKYLTRLKEAKDLKNQLDCKLIVFPNLSPPPVNSFFAIINVLFMYINSLALMLMAVLLKKLGLVDTIYLRDPRIAIAFFSPRKLDAVTCVKFPGFYTQETAKDMHITLKNFYLNLLEKMNHIVTNKSDLLIIQSDLYQMVLRKLYNLAHGKRLLIISAGVNFEKLPRAEYRFKKKRKINNYVIGYVGSAEWWNGLDILLDAMYIVQRKIPNAILCVNIGGGKSVTVKNLREKAKKLGVKVVFIDSLPHSKSLKLLSTFDVLVVPRRRTLSTEFTIPIKMIEAFALGVPVIITRHKVLEDKYTHGEDILYVEPEANDVAKKIIMILSSSHLVEKLSKNGIINSREYDYDVLASRLVETVYNMLDCKKRSMH
ncbi:MAG: glycosyltransferase family 4 protein [Candidatus Bathyarchaeia archaeon]